MGARETGGHLLVAPLCVYLDWKIVERFLSEYSGFAEFKFFLLGEPRNDLLGGKQIGKCGEN